MRPQPPISGTYGPPAPYETRPKQSPAAPPPAEAAPPSAWPALSALRWGPGLSDPTPGIVIDKPNRDRMLAALHAADHNDSYALAEREAIRYEHWTVAEEFAHRGGHRAVLKGLRMEHLPTHREFTCCGSEWAKDEVLILHATDWQEPKTRPPGLYCAADYDPTRFNPPAKLAASQCALRAPWPAECQSPDEPEDDGPDVPDALPPRTWSDIDGFTPAVVDAMIGPFRVAMWWRRMGDGAIHDAAMDCFSGLVSHLDEERQDVFYGWIEDALEKAKTCPDGSLKAAIEKAKACPE
jgi:hypothetical protein